MHSFVRPHDTRLTRLTNTKKKKLQKQKNY